MKITEEDLKYHTPFDTQGINDDNIRILGVDVSNGKDCSVHTTLNRLTKEYTSKMIDNQGV